jgi:DNA-binding PadR family transcriptional regulator
MLRFAILELLSHKPLSGYELKKRFGGSIVFFWRAGHSQIYPELKRMAEEGLVTRSEIAHEWRPTKKVYALTEKGKAELVAWIRRKAKIQVVKDEMMLKCFAFHLIPAEEAKTQIEHHRALHERRLEFYRGLERQLARKHGNPLETTDPILFWNTLTLRHAISFERMYVEWCDWACAEQEAFEARSGSARVPADRPVFGPSGDGGGSVVAEEPVTESLQ